MEDQERHDTLTLGIGQYTRILSRHWGIICVSAALGILSGIAYLANAPTQITATTQVYPYVISTDPFNPQRQESQILDPAREAKIAGSLSVARRAARHLPKTNSSEVRGASSVSIPSDGGAANVSYTAPTRSAAVKGADTVAAAYLSYRSISAQTQVKLMVAKLSPRISDLSKQLTTANHTIATTRATSTKHAAATGDRDRIQTELGGLYNERNDLLRVDTRGGETLVPAADHAVSSSPKTTTTMLTGLAAGLVLGIVGAFIRHRFDRRLRSTTDVEDALGRPVSTTIPTTSLSIPVTGRAADSLRVARERLTDVLGLDASLLLVVDTTGDADLRVAAGLATVVAETGRPVRLVVASSPSQDLQNLVSSPGGGSPSSPPPALELCAPTPTATNGHLDAQVRAGLSQPTPGMLVIAAASSTDPQMTLLELLRHADAALPVVRVQVSHRATVDWVRDQASSMNTPLVGAIALAPWRSGFRRGTRPAPQEARSRARSERASNDPAHLSPAGGVATSTTTATD